MRKCHGTSRPSKRHLTVCDTSRPHGAKKNAKTFRFDSHFCVCFYFAFSFSFLFSFLFLFCFYFSFFIKNFFFQFSFLNFTMALLDHHTYPRIPIRCFNCFFFNEICLQLFTNFIVLSVQLIFI